MSRIVREPPPRNFDPAAPRAVLINKGSPTACIFSNAEKFAQNSANTAAADGSSRAFDLTCTVHAPGLAWHSSPPGMALVQKQPAPRGPYPIDGANWMVLDCGISSTPGRPGAKCTFDNGFLQRPYDNRVLNVSEWKYEPGTGIQFVRDRHDKDGRGKTRTAHGKQGGRGWVFNSDGTLSPIEAPHLVIGMSGLSEHEAPQKGCYMQEAPCCCCNYMYIRVKDDNTYTVCPCSQIPWVFIPCIFPCCDFHKVAHGSYSTTPPCGTPTDAVWVTETTFKYFGQECSICTPVCGEQVPMKKCCC